MDRNIKYILNAIINFKIHWSYLEDTGYECVPLETSKQKDQIKETESTYKTVIWDANC